MKMSLSLTLLSTIGSLAVVHTASAQSWTPQRTGITTTVRCIKAVDENTVWATSDSGVYLRTTDGGTNWTAGVVSGAASITFFSIAPIDKDTAYLMGSNFSNADDGRIYKTTDGGMRWTLQYRNTSRGVFFNSIAFWDKDNGIAFSDPVDGSFLIITTTNGGATWNQVPAANIPSPLRNEIGGFVVGGTCLAVEGTSNAWFGTVNLGRGGPVRVFRTTNKGLNWTVANTPFPTSTSDYGISTIAFKDSLNGFAGGLNPATTSSRLMQTTNGGRSWTMLTSFPPGELGTIVYVPNTANRVLVATTLRGIGSVYSQDGGATWKSISNALYLGLTFVNPTTGWATGVSGLLVKFNGNLSTAVVEQKTDKPLALGLSQNYPNPFNPATTIQYGLSKTERVTLKVYNLLGEEIVTLVNDVQKPAGYHTAIWYRQNKNGEVVASGVYIYRLHAESFTLTKKMALVK